MDYLADTWLTWLIVALAMDIGGCILFAVGFFLGGALDSVKWAAGGCLGWAIVALSSVPWILFVIGVIAALLEYNAKTNAI